MDVVFKVVFCFLAGMIVVVGLKVKQDKDTMYVHFWERIMRQAIRHGQYAGLKPAQLSVLPRKELIALLVSEHAKQVRETKLLALGLVAIYFYAAEFTRYQFSLETRSEIQLLLPFVFIASLVIVGVFLLIMVLFHRPVFDAKRPNSQVGPNTAAFVVFNVLAAVVILLI